MDGIVFLFLSFLSSNACSKSRKFYAECGDRPSRRSCNCIPHYYSAHDREVEYCDERVCASVEGLSVQFSLCRLLWTSIDSGIHRSINQSITEDLHRFTRGKSAPDPAVTSRNDRTQLPVVATSPCGVPKSLGAKGNFGHFRSSEQHADSCVWLASCK